MRNFNVKDYIIKAYDDFLERKQMEEIINMFHPNDRSKDDKLLAIGTKAAKTLVNNKSKLERGKRGDILDRQNKIDYS